MTEIQILQVIGQLEASVNKIEPYLNPEEFKEYCDSTYSSISTWRSVLKEVKETNSDKVSHG